MSAAALTIRFLAFGLSETASAIPVVVPRRFCQRGCDHAALLSVIQLPQVFRKFLRRDSDTLSLSRRTYLEKLPKNLERITELFALYPEFMTLTRIHILK